MAIAGVGRPKSAEDGWAPQMANWTGRGTDRGLLGLGETRKGGGEIVRKKGSLHQLCRLPYISTLNKWCEIVGVPPVVSGESLKRGIAAGRFRASYQPPTLARNTRHQQVLVRMNPAEELNFLQPFFLFMTAGYCKALHPPVEDSSDAAKAVLGFMLEKKTKTQLLANVSQYICPMHMSNTYPQHISPIHMPNTYTFTLNAVPGQTSTAVQLPNLGPVVNRSQRVGEGRGRGRRRATSQTKLCPRIDSPYRRRWDF